MRRLVPWVLLSLVALGAAAGAALGIAHRTAPEAPSQWVAAVLATTERAATARFSYVHATSSPNADLRGSLSGHGEVDFATGDAQVTEVDHEVGFTSTGNQPLHPVHSSNTVKAVVIGGTVYQANPIPGLPFTAQYHVLRFPKLPRARNVGSPWHSTPAWPSTHCEGQMPWQRCATSVRPASTAWPPRSTKSPLRHSASVLRTSRPRS